MCTEPAHFFRCRRSDKNGRARLQRDTAARILARVFTAQSLTGYCHAGAVYSTLSRVSCQLASFPGTRASWQLTLRLSLRREDAP
jgi:hypothetical protein